jgi:hypothetical protein
MTRRRIEPWDFPSRADERRRAFAPEIIDVEYRVIRQRPVSFVSCLVIGFSVMAVAVSFLWRPLLMAFVLLGVTSPAMMFAVLLAVVIIGAAALQAKASGRPF